MNQRKLILILLIGLSYIKDIAYSKIINCYYGTWSNYRVGDGKFQASNIDPKLCTHISYAFFGITAAGEFRILDKWLDLDNGLGMISKTLALKQQNTKLKVLAVVGGWKQGSVNYSRMAGDFRKRKVFINTTLNFIKQHKFDGLDLDWEYPGLNGGNARDKTNFVILLKELKEALKPLNLELGIAVGASLQTARISYDIPNIVKHVDFINVMTYDFATASDGTTGFNTPLRGQNNKNIQTTIDYWLGQGAPASKLLLGLAFYGRTFRLSNTQQNTIGSPTRGAGFPGPFTKEAGYMGYNEICPLTNTWTYKWANIYDVPYIFKGHQWISYDNVKSIEKKVDFALGKNLAGVMIWSIDTDDFRGKCGQKYPLLNAVNKKFGKL